MSALEAQLRDAVARLQAGQAREAEALLVPLAQSTAQDAGGWFAVGVARHMLGRLEAALEAFSTADRLRPDDARTVNARACILGLLGRREEALAGQMHALALAPRDPQVLTNVGIALEDLGRTAEAIERYDAALAANPDWLAARLNRSAARMRLGRFAEALADADDLLQRDPRSADALFNRCEALLALDRYEEALAAASRVLALDPARVAAMVNRAVALACLGQIGEAREAFARARETDPRAFAAIVARASRHAGIDATSDGADLPDPRAIYLVRGVARLERCDWTGRDTFLRRFEQIVREGEAGGDPVTDPALPFAMVWLPLADDVRRSVLRAAGRHFTRGVPAGTEPRPSPPRLDRLRVGCLSPNFREHPAALVNAPLMANLDRERVEVIGYAIGPRGEGELARRMYASCDVVRHIADSDDETAARVIREDGVHILVDIAGYSEGARPAILARRPAPINVGYLGNPETTASDWIDYRLTDAVITPPEVASHWSERLVYLPRGMFVYDPQQPIDPAAPARADVGLPSEGFVFCSFNTAYKIEPGVFALWMDVLRQVPGSVLWVLADGAAAERLRAEARVRGVDPTRLVFAPRLTHARHLARMGLADLFLDTLVCNAHTTAVDALHAGVPVLTMPGTTMPARCAAGIVLSAGLPELVAGDASAYVAAAVRLATEPARLAALRDRLRRARGTAPLWNPQRFARLVEWAFEHMWSRHVAGLAPESFTVPPDARPERGVP